MRVFLPTWIPEGCFVVAKAWAGYCEASAKVVGRTGRGYSHMVLIFEGNKLVDIEF